MDAGWLQHQHLTHNIYDCWWPSKGVRYTIYVSECVLIDPTSHTSFRICSGREIGHNLLHSQPLNSGTGSGNRYTQMDRQRHRTPKHVTPAHSSWQDHTQHMMNCSRMDDHRLITWLNYMHKWMKCLNKDVNKVIIIVYSAMNRPLRTVWYNEV